MSCAKLLLSEKSELLIPSPKAGNIFIFFFIFFIDDLVSNYLIPGPSVDPKLLWTESKLFGQNQKLRHITLHNFAF